MAKWHNKEDGIDYKKVYSPIAHLEILLLHLHYAKISNVSDEC